MTGPPAGKAPAGPGRDGPIAGLAEVNRHRRKRWGTVLLACAVAALVLVPGVRGSEEEGGTHGLLEAPILTTIVWAAVSFLAVLLILRRYAWPTILKALDERERKIRESVETAERTQKECERMIGEQRQELDRARGEAHRFIEEGKTQGSRLAQSIEEKAKSEAREILRRAEAEIGRAKEKALDEIREEATGLSFAIAERLLERSLDPGDHEELVNECLQRYVSDTGEEER